jgi:hypothetical protein
VASPETWRRRRIDARERDFMKTALAVVMLIVLLCVAGAAASDVAGKWSGTFKASGGDRGIPQVVIFKQEGNKLTGSAGPDADEQYPIENGRIEGNRVRFELTSGEWRFSYDLQRAGDDEMKGNLELTSVNNRRTAVVSLSRVK